MIINHPLESDQSFLTKRPPNPPFFFGGITTVPLPPFLSSTFLRIGSVSSSWSSFASPPRIQSSRPFSSLLPPLAAVAAYTRLLALPVATGAKTIVREAILVYWLQNLAPEEKSMMFVRGGRDNISS
ncbi:unnamed protein product [Prunus brigantina]